MAQAVKSWMASYPAVRMAHRADYPAGRGLEAWQDDQGATWLKSLIVDDQAKRMVRSRVLSAYSVGIADAQQRKSARCPRYEIVGGRLIVDSPSNARCGIEVCKSAGGVPRYSGKAWSMAGDRDMAKAEKHLRKAAKLLGVDAGDLEVAGAGVFKSREFEAAEAALKAEKALRAHARAALDFTHPGLRQMAGEALRGTD